MVENTRAVPTASAPDNPAIRTRAGVVKLPPPIPVNPTNKAITNPMRTCIRRHALKRCESRIPVFVRPSGQTEDHSHSSAKLYTVDSRCWDIPGCKEEGIRFPHQPWRRRPGAKSSQPEG